MTGCLLCQQERCSELVNFGLQPVCHHFFDGHEPESVHPLILGECENCRLVQLTKRIAVEQLVPRFDWLVYNEPERHLDELVAGVRALPGVSPDNSVCGVSHKDESTLKRLADHGFEHVWRIEREADLTITSAREGIETIQNRIQPPLAEKLRAKHGAPDIVIARHVLEHTHDTRGFLETLHRLLKPSGYLVIEVPDCARHFDLLDYSALWEDHTLYFDETTLRSSLATAGFSVVRVDSYYDPYEVVMVAIAKVQTRNDSQPFAAAPPVGSQEVRRFARAFEQRRQTVRRLLAKRRQAGKIALFGAGHRAAMFVNLMGVGDLLEFVIDDHPHKRGKQIPGSRLPMVSSENLMREDVKLCLSSLASGSEKKVVERHAAFVQRGGTFASIYPTLADEPFTFLAGPKPISAQEAR